MRVGDVRAGTMAAMLAVLASGCGGTEPQAAPTVDLIAPLTAKVNLAQEFTELGRPIGCAIPVGISVKGGGSVTLERLRVKFFLPGDNGVVGEATLGATDLRAIYGATLGAGTTKSDSLALTSSQEFTAQMELEWRPTEDTRRQVTSRQLDCLAPLVGTFVLQSVDNARLPYEYSGYATVADTLVFYPDISYAASGRTRIPGGTVDARRYYRRTYGIANNGALSLIGTGVVSGAAITDGSSVFVTSDTPGLVGRLFRYDRVGGPPPGEWPARP